MDKPNDIIIRYSVYGFLIGIIFPFTSLLLHSLPGNASFTLHGFVPLHKLFPGQILLDIVPMLTTLAGIIAGIQTARNKVIINRQRLDGQQRSEKILDFTAKLIHKQLDAELELKDANDPLGEALVNLRNNLKSNTEEQQNRKMEDDQRNWISEGLATVGDILRKPFENMEEFSHSIISYLVKYLNANQGGFFLIEQDEDDVRYIDLKASYAYDRKKFANKRVEWGEGLIGTCALEKESIHMTNLPDGYLEITSGLGLATPDNLLIVPLITQDEVLGILELASFNSIEKFEISFVKSVAERTAITISSLWSSIRTASLLKESQSQAEVMAQQEDKMRQNMEQLKETQEQAAHQAEKFISFTNSVNHTLIRAEYGTDGTMLYANTKFLHKLGYFSNSEVEGQHISKFIDDKDREWFDPIWKRLSEGGKHYEGYMKHVSKEGQDLWAMSTYTCVRKDDGSVEKVLFLAIDNTEQKKQSLDYEGQVESLNRLNIKAEFAPDGKFINCNELFLDTLKYSRNELEKMSVFEFIEKNELDSFHEIWEGITRGIAYQGQMKTRTKYEDEKWFRVSYTAVNDMYGEVSKVIYLATDITHERIMELESRKYTDQLKLQEDKLKLASVELKKKLEQSKTDLEAKYQLITRERNRFEKTLADLADIVLSIDQASRIIFINRAAEKFWNIKAGNILGKDIKSLFPEESGDYDSFLVSLFNPRSTKLIGEKKNVKIPGGDGRMHSAQILLSMSETADEVSYTLFISLV